MQEKETVIQPAAQELAALMCAVHLPRIAEMPRVGLYMDQVLEVVTSELAFLAVPGEKPLTAAMVNNYVKQHIVPAPVKKRYTRRHLASIIFVTAFKRVFTIAEVGSLLSQVRESGADLGRLYDDLCSSFEAFLAYQFLGGEGSARELAELTPRDEAGNPVAPELARVLQSAVVSLATKTFVEQSLLLAASVATGEESVRR